MHLDEFAAQLQRVNPTSEGIKASCPAHEDRIASLSVREFQEKLLVRCFAGCTPQAIVGAMGLEMRDLFNDSRNGSGPPRQGKANAPGPQPVGPPIPYRLIDHHNQLQAIHWRHDFADGSKKMWFEKDGTPGLKGLSTRDLPLYRINIIKNEKPGTLVAVCEGEKATEAAFRGGFPTVGTVCGAGTTPSRASLEPLMPFPVALTPDNDAAGFAHKGKIALELRDMGHKDVRWLPPRPGAPEKADLADFEGDEVALRAYIESAVPLDYDQIKAFTEKPGSNGRADGPNPWDEKDEPALSALRVMDMDEFYAATEHLENVGWRVDRLMPATGIVGVFAPPEGGKSTLSRTLAVKISGGEEFLGRATNEGTVLYLDLANEALSHRRAFQKLGFDANRLKIVSQDSLTGDDRALELVDNAVKECGAKVVIVDMMADLLTFKDLNDYANAKETLRGLRKLVRLTDALYIIQHHTSKAASGEDSDVLQMALGSQAIMGFFDLRIGVRQRDRKVSTIEMTLGKIGGDPITEERVLNYDEETGLVTLGDPWGSARAAHYMPKVINFLKEHPGEKYSASAMAEELKFNAGWIRSAAALAAKRKQIMRKKHSRFYDYWFEIEATKEEGLF